MRLANVTTTSGDGQLFNDSLASYYRQSNTSRMMMMMTMLMMLTIMMI